VRLSFFAVSCVESEFASETDPGVASLPMHAAELETNLRAEKAEGRTVICLAHWGHEYTDAIQEEQQHWARWLIDHGADLVVGSHPHVVQSLDTWRGKWIAYSLGNAVFPRRLNALGSAGWLDVGIGADGSIVSADLRRGAQISEPRAMQSQRVSNDGHGAEAHGQTGEHGT
jgi:poly-gamma-glutamate synthesis protein (capsule biosynthesis protein)